MTELSALILIALLVLALYVPSDFDDFGGPDNTHSY